MKLNHKNYIKKVIKIMSITLLIGLYTIGVTYAMFSVSQAIKSLVNVAEFGIIELKEHRIELVDNKYQFTDEEINLKNGDILDYNYLKPDMIIPKDLFVIVSGTFEVTYELYMKIIEVNFPTTISYKIEDSWLQLDITQDSINNTKTKTYKYMNQIEIDQAIYVLKDNQLVIDKYFSEGEKFNLIIAIWIEQTN